MSLPRRAAARARSRASASCSCSRTTPTGCCATRATRCRRCARSTAATSSSTWARSRRSSRPASALGWAVAPRPVLEKMNLGKQAADLCSSSLTQLFVGAYFERGALAGLPALADRALPPPARHDARRARRALPARGRVDAPAGRAVHLGDAARLHRHDRPAGARAARERRLRARPRRVPRRPRRLVDAAELLRRRPRTTSARACAASARSCASRSSCTARSPGARRAGAGAGAAPSRDRRTRASPTCSSCPRRDADGRRAARRRRPMSTRRRPQGRALARAPGVAAVRRARRGRARAPRPRGGRDRRRRRTSSRACARPSPTSPSSRCTAATARTARSRSCSRSSACPTPARASPPASAAPTRCSPSTLLRDAGIPTPDFYAFNETAFQELGAAEALPAIEERLDFPIVVKPAARARRSGIKFAAQRRGRARPRWSRRSPTTARCCSSATSTGATSRSRSSRATTAPRRCRSSRRCRNEERLLRLRGALRDRAHDVRLPGRADRTHAAERAQELALEAYRAARLLRLRARRPDARRRDRRALRARGQRDPRA